MNSLALVEGKDRRSSRNASEVDTRTQASQALERLRVLLREIDKDDHPTDTWCINMFDVISEPLHMKLSFKGVSAAGRVKLHILKILENTRDYSVIIESHESGKILCISP